VAGLTSVSRSSPPVRYPMRVGMPAPTRGFSASGTRSAPRSVTSRRRRLPSSKRRSETTPGAATASCSATASSSRMPPRAWPRTSPPPSSSPPPVQRCGQTSPRWCSSSSRARTSPGCWPAAFHARAASASWADQTAAGRGDVPRVRRRCTGRPPRRRSTAGVRREFRGCGRSEGTRAGADPPRGGRAAPQRRRGVVRRVPGGAREPGRPRPRREQGPERGRP